MSMNLLRRKAAESRPLTDEQLTIAWQTASLLLDYPDESLPERLALARRAYDALPDAVGGPLRATVERLDGVALGDLAADYVETFDSRRRHNLFLTYFAHGDTRKRGVRCCGSSRPTSPPASSPRPRSCPTTSAWCSSSPRRSTVRPAGS